MSAYEPCSNCGGHGHVDGLYGIATCSACKGDCYVRARDERGRFVVLEDSAEGAAHARGSGGHARGGSMKRTPQTQLQDLVAKLQFLVDYMYSEGMLEADGCFTFPDGDTWQASQMIARKIREADGR